MARHASADPAFKRTVNLRELPPRQLRDNNYGTTNANTSTNPPAPRRGDGPVFWACRFRVGRDFQHRLQRKSAGHRASLWRNAARRRNRVSGARWWGAQANLRLRTQSNRLAGPRRSGRGAESERFHRKVQTSHRRRHWRGRFQFQLRAGPAGRPLRPGRHWHGPNRLVRYLRQWRQRGAGDRSTKPRSPRRNRCRC